MLRNQWQDANFGIGAISDRVPFRSEDEIVVLAAPDPQGKLPSRAHSASPDIFTLEGGREEYGKKWEEDVQEAPGIEPGRKASRALMTVVRPFCTDGLGGCMYCDGSCALRTTRYARSHMTRLSATEMHLFGKFFPQEEVASPAAFAVQGVIECIPNSQEQR